MLSLARSNFQLMRNKVLELIERDAQQQEMRRELEALKEVSYSICHLGNFVIIHLLYTDAMLHLKSNADLAMMYESKLKAREEIMEKLGVDLTDPNNSLPPSAEVLFPKNKKMYERFWARIRARLTINPRKSDTRCIRVKQGFRLQELFEEWYENSLEANRKGEFATILFRDFENRFDVEKLLSRWTITCAGE